MNKNVNKSDIINFIQSLKIESKTRRFSNPTKIANTIIDIYFTGKIRSKYLVGNNYVSKSTLYNYFTRYPKLKEFIKYKE